MKQTRKSKMLHRNPLVVQDWKMATVNWGDVDVRSWTQSTVQPGPFNFLSEGPLPVSIYSSAIFLSSFSTNKETSCRPLALPCPRQSSFACFSDKAFNLNVLQVQSHFHSVSFQKYAKVALPLAPPCQWFLTSSFSDFPIGVSPQFRVF